MTETVETSDGSMRRILDSLDEAARGVTLEPEYAAIVAAGVQRRDDAILLTAHLRALQHMPSYFDRWETERWVNKVHLDSDRDPTDPLWRPELVAQGLQLARALLDAAAFMTTNPVQALLCLQSAPGRADPEIDFAVGALFITQMTAANEDMSKVDDATQPVLVLTRGSISSS